MTLRKYNPSALQNMLGIAIMALVIGIVLFGGTAALTKENIEAQLNRFSDYVSSATADNGKEGKFNYAGVDVEGWGRGKKAIITNTSLEIGEKSLLDTTKWSFSTAHITVMPNFSAHNRLDFVLDEPINIIQNSQLKATLTSPAPIVYGFYESGHDNNHVVNHVLKLPSPLIFTPGKSAGDGPDRGNRLMITFDPGTQAMAVYHAADQSRDVSYQFSNIKVVSDEGSEASIDKIACNYREQESSEKQFNGKYHWELSNLTWKNGSNVTPPYSIAADIGYTGERPAMDVRSLMPKLGGNSELTFEKLDITSQDFSGSVTGHLSTSTEDPLPSGDVELVLVNPQKAIDSDLVMPALRAPVTHALEKITGQPVASQPRIVIPLKRAKLGTFYIGNVTFEELTAMLLKDALKSANEQPPVLPPATGSDQPAAPNAQPAVIVPAPAAKSPAESPALSPHAGADEKTGDTQAIQDNEPLPDGDQPAPPVPAKE